MTRSTSITISFVLFVITCCALSINVQAQVVGITGCSTSQSPYMENTMSNSSTTSILTTGDQIGSSTMVGAPDGLGAFDNGNGTFTLLMNHEIPSGSGITRAHGSKGSFVSKYILDKSTLCIQSGADLIQSVQLWNGSAFTSGSTAFNRFCSGDLPTPTAFYNSSTGKGTQARMFMNGEEGGVEGRAFAHIVNGTNAGVSWQLPWLGRYNMENIVACPYESDKTIVAGTDDAPPGQVYFYIGTKQNTGTEVERAGLQNGHLFGVAVSGLAMEVSGSFPAANTAFYLVDLGDVHNMSGSQLNANSNVAGVTNFLRPEDGAWDPSNLNDFYFNTTNAFSEPSRLWRLRFTDITQPELGGTITAVLDGTEGQKMLDNITVDPYGRIMLQEDPGGNAHNAKIWQYDIATDLLSLAARHDPSRFVSGGANFLTENEESSGIIDVSSILGPGNYLVSVMAHYGINAQLFEGGQLLLLTMNNSIRVNVRAMLEGPYDQNTGLMYDSLRVHSLIPLNEPYTALGYTHVGGGGETIAPSILSTIGPNAIVDWVALELRDATTPSTIVATHAALIQRDGDVVWTDGTSQVPFTVAPGNYYVAIRHRNHLGCLTATALPLIASPLIDLSDPTMTVYGVGGLKDVGGTMVLLTGNVIRDGDIRYTGTNNDRDQILTAIGGVVPTNTVTSEYRPEDLNMDGVVRYTGSKNDRDLILNNIGGVVPTNSISEQVP
ncbi:MAG: DUF839 domain-containing protein [Flavobacteriales bacterium]|nr:DUF839 domain-containing protein [Flavobacteriales bacterium]